MTLRTYKFQVLATVQMLDEDGGVVGEQTLSQQDGQPFTFFGERQAIEWLERFAETLENVPTP